jgi:hypothetical protein
MSLSTITASRIYLGQMSGHSGEESNLYFENFPYLGLSKVIMFFSLKRVWYLKSYF